MKRFSLAMSCVVVGLALASSAGASAGLAGRQENAGAGSRLEASLDELEGALKGSVALDFRQRYARRTYTRLKREGGCRVSFAVSRVPGGAIVSDPDRPAGDLSYEVWKVNLSGLDRGGVAVETPSKGDYRLVRFAALAGEEAIKLEGRAVGESGWAAEGRLYVGEKDAAAVAAALEGAISACSE